MCSSLSSSFVRSFVRCCSGKFGYRRLFFSGGPYKSQSSSSVRVITSLLRSGPPCRVRSFSFVVTGGIIWQRVLAKGPAAAAAAAQLTIVLNSIISIPFNLIMLRNWTFVAQLLRLKHSNKMWRYGLACAVRNRKASANSLAIRRYYHRRRRRRSSSFSFPLVKESELGIYK